MAKRLPTDELREEHQAALDGFEGLRQALEGVRGGGGADGGGADESRAWAGLRKRLDEVRALLLLHFRKEEDGLFPDVVSLVSRDAPRVDILTHFFGEEADDDLKAHTLLRGRLRELTEMLEGEAAGLGDEAQPRLESLLGMSRDLLERHAAKEHKLVFPMIERLLDESQMAAAQDRMESLSRE